MDIRGLLFLSYNWYKDVQGNTISTKQFLTVNETAIYYLEIGDSLDCKSTDSVALLVTTSVNTKQIASNFQVFPNPAQHQIQLQFEGKEGILEVFDINGRLVLTEIIINDQIIDLNQFEKGTYLVRLKANDESNTQVFIKK